MVKYQSGDDYSGGKFLEDPGDYHMIVDSCELPALTKHGSVDMKNFFNLQCSVLAGPPGTEGKEKKFFFKKPTPNDNTNFRQKKIDRTLIALGFLDPDKKNVELDLEPEQFVGRQFCVRMSTSEGDNGRKYLDINFSDIFHVDDPACSSYPKNENALKAIDPGLRRKAKEEAAAVPGVPTKDPAVKF